MTLQTLWLSFCCLYSLGCISVLYKLCSVQAVCEMGDLWYFQKGQFMGDGLARASVTLTAQLLSVLWCCLVFHSLYDYDCIHKPWQHVITKRNNGRKPKVNNRDCQTLRRIVSKQHRTTAIKWQQTSIFTLNTLFPQNHLQRTSQSQHPCKSCNR